WSEDEPKMLGGQTRVRLAEILGTVIVILAIAFEVSYVTGFGFGDPSDAATKDVLAALTTQAETLHARSGKWPDSEADICPYGTFDFYTENTSNGRSIVISIPADSVRITPMRQSA